MDKKTHTAIVDGLRELADAAEDSKELAASIATTLKWGINLHCPTVSGDTAEWQKRMASIADRRGWDVEETVGSEMHIVTLIINDEVRVDALARRSDVGDAPILTTVDGGA